MSKAKLKILPVLITIALLGYLATIIPIKDIVNAATHISLSYVALALAVSLFVKFLHSVQMSWILGRQKSSLSILNIYVINLITSFYTLFLPGTLAGGAVRWYQFTKSGVKAESALAAIIFSRLFEVSLTVGMGVIFLATDFGKLEGAGQVVTLVGFVLFLLLMYWLLFNRAAHVFIRSLLARFWFGKAINKKVLVLLDALAKYDSLGFRFHIKLCLMGLCRFLISNFAIYLFALSLGIGVSFVTLAWIGALFSLLLMLPISISGFGVREATFVLTLTQYGVPAESALLLSLLLFIREVFIGCIGGLLEFERVFFDKTYTGWLSRKRSPAD